ncbi:MAG: hypothetical protein IT373_26135 [Polyangiaceae bacterium]|nr:hypothetical protein [Polyangiaceae bacterium]
MHVWWADGARGEDRAPFRFFAFALTAEAAIDPGRTRVLLATSDVAHGLGDLPNLAFVERDLATGKTIAETPVLTAREVGDTGADNVTDVGPAGDELARKVSERLVALDGKLAAEGWQVLPRCQAPPRLASYELVGHSEAEAIAALTVPHTCPEGSVSLVGEWLTVRGSAGAVLLRQRVPAAPPAPEDPATYIRSIASAWLDPARQALVVRVVFTRCCAGGDAEGPADEWWVRKLRAQ